MWKELDRDPECDGPYWVRFVGGFKDLEWEANVKWDGCVELVRRHNIDSPNPGDGDSEWIHLCDLEETIKRLEALRDAAKAVLGPRHGLYCGSGD